MKQKTSKFFRIVSSLLALLLCALPLCSCASSGGTLMTLGKTELSVSTYELLLSRMKGTLAYNGYEVNNAAFWDYIWSTDGATYEDYFNAEILAAAKDMLLRLYLFEEVYDLTLPQSYYDEIDVYMQDLLENDFGNSKNAFNKAMAEYGINMDMLRENYVMEDKLEYLATYLSARTADSARVEYYEDHYVRFRQILFPLYEYEYELDENGDVIYLQTGKNVVAYDTKNGKTMKATDGTLRVDEDGNPIYFLEDGSIAYDTVNGEPAGVDADADGYVDSKPLSKEEIANIKENASKLQGLIEAGDFSTFEAYGAQYAGDDGVWDAYPDGIFLNSEQEYSLAYLQELADQLQVAQVGDVILYESANALHLVMKYELTENAWKEESNKDWFGTFEDEVIESVISSLCAEYADEIVIDQEALAKATGIKEIGANWNY
jgi:hypothetical protein